MQEEQVKKTQKQIELKETILGSEGRVKRFLRSFADWWDSFEMGFIWPADQGLSLERGPQAIGTGSDVNKDSTMAVNGFIASHPLIFAPLQLAIFVIAIISFAWNLIKNHFKEKEEKKNAKSKLSHAYDYVFVNQYLNLNGKLEDDNKSNLDAIAKQLNERLSKEDREKYKFIVRKRMKEEKGENGERLLEYVIGFHEKCGNVSTVRNYSGLTWKSISKGAYWYWILWFTAWMIASILVGTAIALTSATGAPIALIPFLFVIGLPVIVGALYFVSKTVKKWITRSQSAKTEEGEYQIVVSRNTQQKIAQAAMEKYALEEQLKQSGLKINNPKNNDSERQEDKIKLKASSEQPTQVTSSDQASLLSPTPEQQKSTETHRFNVAWVAFRDALAGYTGGTFIAWFTFTLVTAPFDLIGSTLLAPLLAATIFGLPAALAVIFLPGLISAAIFAYRGGSNAQKEHRKRDEFALNHPEKSPAGLQRRTEAIIKLDEVKAYKEAYEANLELIAKYNKLKCRAEPEKTPSQIDEYYKLLLKPESSNFTDYAWVFVDRGINMAYVARSLTVGGALAIAALTYVAITAAVLTNPIILGAVIFFLAVTFGIFAVANKVYQNYLEKKSSHNLELQDMKLRAIEQNEKHFKDQLTNSKDALIEVNKALAIDVGKLEEKPKSQFSKLFSFEKSSPKVENEKDCESSFFCGLFGGKHSTQSHIPPSPSAPPLPPSPNNDPQYQVPNH